MRLFLIHIFKCLRKSFKVKSFMSMMKFLWIQQLKNTTEKGIYIFYSSIHGEI